MIILTALDAESMLPTISSRCRTIPLRPLPQPLIEQSLRLRWNIDSEQSHLLSHLADGRLGWAVERAKNPTILESREALLEQFYDILDGDVVFRFQVADTLAKKTDVLPAHLQTWLTWWRDLVMLTWENSQEQATLTNVDQLSLLQKYAGKWSQTNVFASLKQTKLALWQLERNANTKLVLENLFLTYPET
jgi:DNA polymerase-3 subunit delta'